MCRSGKGQYLVCPGDEGGSGFCALCDRRGYRSHAGAAGWPDPASYLGISFINVVYFSDVEHQLDVKRREIASKQPK